MGRNWNGPGGKLWIRPVPAFTTWLRPQRSGWFNRISIVIVFFVQ
jgi:hypothetical protein